MKTKQKPAPKRNSSNSKAISKTRLVEPTIRINSGVLRPSEERFRNIFDTVPVSIWEEDFSEVKKALDDLRSQGVTDFRRYLMEHPEFVSDAMQKLIVIDVNEVTIKLYEAKDKVELMGSKDTTFGPQMLDSFTDELNALASGKSYFEGEVVDQTLRGQAPAPLENNRVP